MASSFARHAVTNRSALIRSVLLGAAANLLAAGSALYARPLQDALWAGTGDGSLLLLVAVALGLFALYALLGFAQSRELARLVPSGMDAGWLERLWVPEAAWAPVHLAVLALLSPLMGAVALAGIAALAATIAVGATGPASPTDAQPQLSRLAGADSFGCADGFLAGLGFCETVYRVLIVGLGAALLMRGELEPGLFVAVSVIGLSAMRAAARAAARWHGGRRAAAVLLTAGRM
ncbi:hypothetical protein EI613_04285 [Azospirillum sp. 412522]|nr:hypothetical protein [Azospirillum sp. 412522]MBY6261145.1 hypothetical protein [Azospirillum sp. 412522]